MSIETFIQNFKDAMDTEDNSWLDNLTPETQYQEQAEWDSLALLCLLSMLDTEYNLSVTALQTRECKTIKELYALTQK